MANDIFLYPVPAFSNPNDICLRILTSAQTGVGGGARRTIPRPEFEKRLKAQRDSTFSRRRFDELVAAEEAAAAKAVEAKSKREKAALERAANAASEVIEEAQESYASPREFKALATALQAAATAKNIKAIVEQSRLAVIAAHAAMKAIRDAEDQDEEEVIMMLLS